MVETERTSYLKKALFDTGQDEEWSFLVSFYYTVQTATTIGFGDIYVYSPGHAILNIAPIVSTLVTAFSIALFAKIFSKLQEGVEKTAGKTTETVAAIQLGVMRVNLTAKHNGEENIEDVNNLDNIEEVMFEI